jgi:hypothetical protein
MRGMKQYQENVGDAFKEIGNSILKEYGVQHSDFHDIACLTHFLKDFYAKSFVSKFFNWFFSLGPHFEPVDTELGTYSVDDWFHLRNHDIYSWFEKTLVIGVS